MRNLDFTLEHLNRTSFECFAIKLIGIYLIFTFIAGITLNSFLLWIFYAKKSLRTALNKLVSALAICNLIGCITEIPLTVISSFSCRYLFYLLEFVLNKH